MQRNKQKREQMLLEENIRTLIPQMAIPTIVAQLITTIYNLADTFFVSTLGTNATAAVGINSSLESTITVLGTLIGSGACSYIARLLGAKKKLEADRVLSTSLFTGLGLGVVVIFFGSILMRPLVILLGANEDCIDYSMQYAQYVLFAAPFMMGSFILNMCLKSEGNSMLAMIGIGFGGILNCALDPLFIYGLHLGVAGASMATAISKFVSFCILAYPYIRKRCAVQISPKFFKYVAEEVKEVVAIGSTGFFRLGFAVLSSILVNRVAGTYSTAALAALSVANRIMQFPFAIILGFGQGFQPVAGFNWGAKRMDRVKECYVFSSWVSIIGAVIAGVLLILAAPFVVQLFNKEADAEVLRLGILCIRLQSLCMPVHAWVSIINMFYGGIGKAKYALLTCTARQGYCFIPVLYLASWLLGVEGVAATQAMADILTLAVAIPLGLLAVRLIHSSEGQTA